MFTGICLYVYIYLYITYITWLHKTGYSLELYAYARGGARRSPQKKRIFTMIEFTDQHLLIFGIVLALSILFPDWQWSKNLQAFNAMFLGSYKGNVTA